MTNECNYSNSPVLPTHRAPLNCSKIDRHTFPDDRYTGTRLKSGLRVARSRLMDKYDLVINGLTSDELIQVGPVLPLTGVLIGLLQTMCGQNCRKVLTWRHASSVLTREQDAHQSPLVKICWTTQSHRQSYGLTEPPKPSGHSF